MSDAGVRADQQDGGYGRAACRSMSRRQRRWWRWRWRGRWEGRRAVRAEEAVGVGVMELAGAEAEYVGGL